MSNGILLVIIVDRSINYAHKVMSELSFMTFFTHGGCMAKVKNRFLFVIIVGAESAKWMGKMSSMR